MDRLDKTVAKQMNISRSGAMALIRSGSGRGDGKKIFAADEQLDINSDELKINGKTVTVRRYLYIMLNKPSGVLSAAKESRLPDGRRSPAARAQQARLFPAGRLDKDTTGLLIITDDGDFAHRLISPSHHVYKTYEATLESGISEEQLDILQAGRGARRRHGMSAREAQKAEPMTPAAVCVQIREGKYHQVKRMFASVGNSVSALRRTAIGALKLDNSLKEGEARLLTDDERKMIFSEAEII